MAAVPGAGVNPETLSVPDREARAAVVWPGMAAAVEAALARLEKLDTPSPAKPFQTELESWSRSHSRALRQAAAAAESIFSSPDGMSAANAELARVFETGLREAQAASLTLPDDLQEQIRSRPECSALKFAVAVKTDPLQYLETAIAFIQSNALHRDKVDWPAVRTRAAELAKNARTTTDTYEAIRFVLSSLGDRHSHLSPPANVAYAASGAGSGTPEAVALGDLGYLWLPQTRVSGSAGNQYATAGQSAIREVDSGSPCGWIVDLRANGGGNMWPMLAAVGPILGEGEVGAFTVPGVSTTPWFYRNGASYSGATLVATVLGPAYKLTRAGPPVALLTSGITASSAEAIVVAFSGRALTSRFGTATGGVPTANLSRALSDGALIALTVSYMADRTGRLYEDSIQPDEYVESLPPAERSAQALANDPAVIAASRWLRGQPGCAP